MQTKSRRIIPVWWVPAVAVGLAVFLAQMRFPETLRLMEATNFYVSTPEFVGSTLSHRPGVIALVSAWLLQFFYYPVAGALIEAVLLSLMTLLLSVGLKGVLTGSSKFAAPARILECLSPIPAVTLFLLFPNDLPVYIEGMVVCLLIAVAGWIWRRWRKAVAVSQPRRWDSVLTVALSVAAGLFIYFHTTLNEKAITSERMFRYSQMAELGEWQPLLSDILQSAGAGLDARPIYTGTIYNITDQLDLELALLCEARLHTLPEHLFLYPINTPEAFVPRFDETPFSNNFCRIFYRELGLLDEAYHRAFQYGMSVQVNGGFCMASLRQMALYAAQQGDSALTDKLTYLLSRTTLHSGYVASVRDTLQSALRRGVNPAADTVRADNFVGGYAFPSEVVRLLELQPQNRDFLDYLLCGLLLRKQLDNFNTIIHAFPLYAAGRGGATLPRAYAEAAAMIEAMRPGTMRPFFDYDPAYDEQMREFQRLRLAGEDDSAFRGTFWYYYVYAEIPPLRDWNPQAASS